MVKYEVDKLLKFLRKLRCWRLKIFLFFGLLQLFLKIFGNFLLSCKFDLGVTLAHLGSCFFSCIFHSRISNHRIRKPRYTYDSNSAIPDPQVCLIIVLEKTTTLAFDNLNYVEFVVVFTKVAPHEMPWLRHTQDGNNLILISTRNMGVNRCRFLIYNWFGTVSL